MALNIKKISISKIEAKCEEVSNLLRSLSHPQRLMIMGHLIQGEKTVSELQALCDISQSQLSQFLGRMRLEGLVSSERRARFQYYFVTDERTAKLISMIQALYCR
jgi:ArsR family transcriptional regulator